MCILDMNYKKLNVCVFKGVFDGELIISSLRELRL